MAEKLFEDAANGDAQARKEFYATTAPEVEYYQPERSTSVGAGNQVFAGINVTIQKEFPRQAVEVLPENTQD